jgi:diketogulonate reductase-like aldo/keto reductase
MRKWNRREIMAAGATLGMPPGIGFGEQALMRTKPIPATGERLPVIGLGTHSVFDVASTPDEIALRIDIVGRLVAAGGSLIDTSPMYNRSENVIGEVIRAGVPRADLFLATKVWVDGRDAGARQMQRSAQLLETDVVDLMQVHNLRDTAVHMDTIRQWQAEGVIRYNGLTHYTASAHGALEEAMRKYKPQFIQINYSLGEREAESRLLPLAGDMGIAVIINRPFQAGRLFRAVSGSKLPDWAHGFANSWGQFFLKFIVSHPAVTCVIPATSNPLHMADNLGGGAGALPDAGMRERMAEFMATL